MGGGLSIGQARASVPFRWKRIVGWIAATPFLAVLAMELYYKLPRSIAMPEWPRWASLAARQDEAALDGYAEHSIAARCKERWPSDRSMQLICADNAEAGLADLARIYIAKLSMPGTKAALTACFVRHTRKGITDFALVGICARTHELNNRLETPIPSLMYNRQGGRNPKPLDHPLG